MATSDRHNQAGTSLLTGRTSDFLKIGVAAAGRGDMTTVEAVLREHPTWITRVGSHGRTMLWEAINRGKSEMVAHLLDWGANLDAWGCHFSQSYVELSPYCLAVLKKQEDIPLLLRARGASLDIHGAAFLGDMPTVEVLLEADPARLDREQPQHDPNHPVAVPLHYAVSGGQLSMVKFLIGFGARVKPYAQWLVTIAIWRKQADILQTLIDAGAGARNAKMPRVGINDKEVRGVLERAGVDLDPNEAQAGWPTIVYACRGDKGENVSRVRELLEGGADINVRNAKGQSALHCAARAGFIDVMELLLDNGAEVDAPDAVGETPLASVLRSTIKRRDKLEAAAEMLIQFGADPHRKNDKGRTPMQIARRKRDAEGWLRRLEW